MKKIDVVCALIKDANGRILCCKRGPGRDLEGFFEFPGGKIETGESKEGAIKREIKEELLFDIDVDSFFLTVEHDYEKFHLTMHAFLCSIKNGNPKLTEHTEMEWFSIDEMDESLFAPADRKIVEFIKNGEAIK